MTWLSRIGIAVLVLTLCVFVSALTLSLFPRTVVGAVLLVAVGIPATLLGEGLGELAFSNKWYVRATGILGLAAWLGVLWWWYSIHAAFLHRHFLGVG